MNADFSAKCTEISSDSGYRFQFYCAYCAASHTTGRIHSDSRATAHEIAKSEARRYFNLCPECGRWVCDAHYNENEMICVECASGKTYD